MEGEVAAYFDLDGTLLNASSEKTLTAHLAKRRPWRIPWGALAWTTGFVTNLLRGRAVYDAARNRGHLSLASWEVLTKYSEELAQHRLKQHIPQQAWDKLAWHREQGHRLVLVTATVAPMAEAMEAANSGPMPGKPSACRNFPRPMVRAFSTSCSTLVADFSPMRSKPSRSANVKR